MSNKHLTHSENDPSPLSLSADDDVDDLDMDELIGRNIRLTGVFLQAII